MAEISAIFFCETSILREKYSEPWLCVFVVLVQMYWNLIKFCQSGKEALDENMFNRMAILTGGWGYRLPICHFLKVLGNKSYRSRAPGGNGRKRNGNSGSWQRDMKICENLKSVRSLEATIGEQTERTHPEGAWVSSKVGRIASRGQLAVRWESGDRAECASSP